MILSVILCAVAIVWFAVFDVDGYGILVQGLNDSKEATKAYRTMQISFQFCIYAFLIALHQYGALFGFMLAHWGFGCDAIYYWLRREDYSGYTITWFLISLPSLIFKLIGKPFEGKYLTAIGVCAIVGGLIIAGVLA